MKGITLSNEANYRIRARSNLLTFIENQPGLTQAGGAGGQGGLGYASLSLTDSGVAMAANLKALYEAFIDIERHADTGSYTAN